MFGQMAHLSFEIRLAAQRNQSIPPARERGQGWGVKGEGLELGGLILDIVKGGVSEFSLE
jgi:hypothetical protein